MAAGSAATEGEGRWTIPGFMAMVWRTKEHLTARFPRFTRFLARHGILLLIAAFFLVYAGISLLKHAGFETHGYDLGIFDQAVYQYSRFEIGYNTVRMVPCLLADHWHPALFLFAPLYWIWPDVRMLLLAQALICAVGVLPVYWIAREKLRWQIPALAFSLVYLSFWGIMNLVYFDFHPQVLLPPLIALAYYFVLKTRMAAYFICLPFLLIIQEQVALIVFFMGIWLIVSRRLWFAGIATMLIAAVWYACAVQVFIPGLSAAGTYGYFEYYRYLGDTPGQVARYLLLHPWMAAKLLFWPGQKTLLLFGLFVPFLFLPLFSSFTLILLPELLGRLFSSVSSNWGLSLHYNAVYAPVLVIATMEVLPRLYRRMRRRWPQGSFDFRSMVLALCLVLVLLQLPFTLATSAWRLFTPSFYRLDERDRAGYEALEAVPADASVAAVNAAVPHLSQRERVYLFDGNTFGAEYVLTNADYGYFPLANTEEMQMVIRRLRQDPRYEMTDYGEGWLLFRIKPQFDSDSQGFSPHPAPTHVFAGASWRCAGVRRDRPGAHGRPGPGRCGPSRWSR